MNSDHDISTLLSSFYFNLIIAFVGILIWLFYIRDARNDHLNKDAFYSIENICSDKNNLESTSIKRVLINVWNIDIINFKSKNIYSYLMFLRMCAIVFFVIGLSTLFLELILVYTANINIELDSQITKKSFFERSILSNIPISMSYRLSIIYALVWIISIVILYATSIYYTHIFKNSKHTAHMQPNINNEDFNVFLPEQYTIMIKNVNKHNINLDDFKDVIYNKFGKENVANISLIMDYSYLISTYNKLKKIIRKVERRRNAIIKYTPSNNKVHSFLVRAYQFFMCFKNNDEINIDFITFAKSELNKTNSDAEAVMSDNLTYFEFIRLLQQRCISTNDKISSNEATISNQRILTKYIQKLINPIVPSEVIDNCKLFSCNPELLTSWDKKRLKNAFDSYYFAEECFFDCYSYYIKMLKMGTNTNTGIAFVSFTSNKFYNYVLKSNIKDYNTAHNCNQKNTWMNYWIIQQAPPPNDIIWENIHVSRFKSNCFAIYLNMLVFVILIVLTSSVVVVDLINPLATAVANAINKLKIITLHSNSLIVPNVVYVINNILLPFLVTLAAINSKYDRWSVYSRIIMYSNVWYMILNMLVFPIIGVSTITAFLVYINSASINDLVKLIQTQIIESSIILFTRFIVNTIFINSTMQLLQLPMFVYKHFRKNNDPKTIAWNFDFGFWYAFHIAFFGVIICSSLSFAFIPVFGSIFFSLKYWVDKYNFSMSVWKVDRETGNSIEITAILLILLMECLFLFVMFCYYSTLFINMKTQFNINQNDIKLYAAFVVLLFLGIAIVLFIRILEKAHRSITTKNRAFTNNLLKNIYKFLNKDYSIQENIKEVNESTLNNIQLEKLNTAYLHPIEKYF